MNIIIGAGPTGISAAYHLKKAGKPFLIIEKEDKIGGICRSFELASTLFDWGDHIFYTTNNLYAKDLLINLFKEVGQTFNDQKRSAWVYAFDTFVPFPFQSNLFGLPVNIVKDCLMGLIEMGKESSPPSNIIEWIRMSFGEGILKHFMKPYNEKIWANPLETLMPNWAGDRIIKPDYGQIIEGALARVERPYPSSEFAFPERGGFEEVIKIMAKDLDLKNHLIFGDVQAIDLQYKTVTTDKGNTITFDKLISTMPLNTLTRRVKDIEAIFLEEASKLNSFGIHIVSLVTQRTGFTDKQHVYCAQEDVPWHRLGVHSNLSPYLKSLPTFGLQAEVSFSDYKHVDQTRLVDSVFDSLVRMGIFLPDEPIVATDVRTIDPAYIVYTPGCKDAAEKLVSYFETQDVYCAGRFGEWIYINSDAAIMRGKAAADKC